MDKTIEIQLAELREQIAKDIERHIPYGPMSDITLALTQAAKIARGKHYDSD